MHLQCSDCEKVDMGMRSHQDANSTVSEYLHVDMSTAALKQRSRRQKELYCIIA